MNVKQCILFSILMQNGEGIISKAPLYIQEKLELCENCPDEFLEGLVDAGNGQLFKDYIERWNMHL